MVLPLNPFASEQENNMKLKALALGLLLAASPAFAADVDGNWAGSLDTPNGAVEIKFSFKADGAKLTGNTTGPDGSTLPLRDGKVDGSNIAFAIDVEMGGNAMTFNYTGVVSGTELKLRAEVMGQPIEFTVKKTG
jgi:opacity protein-like surface antigen